MAGLAHRFPDGTEALAGVDLVVASGRFAAVVGPSGGGKSTLLAVLAGLGTGVCIAVQGAMNSQVSQYVGVLRSAFIILLSGTVAVGVALLFGLGGGSWARLREAPPVDFLAGVVGIAILVGVVYAYTRLGFVLGIAVILVAQLGVGSVIDHFGLFGLPRNPVTPWTLAGIALLLAGAVLIRR